MFTRNQYMEKECSHLDYYRQFVNPYIRAFVGSNYTVEFIRKCYESDKNLNNLGSGWSRKFDALTLNMKAELTRTNKRLNDQSVYSLCEGTCAIKAYMREYANLGG